MISYARALQSFHFTWLTPIPRATDKQRDSSLGELLGSFDVSGYDACQNWGVIEWAVAIEFRHLVDVELRHLTQYKEPIYTPYDPGFVSNALEVIRHFPTSLKHLDQSRDALELAVRDMTVGELMWTLDDLVYSKDQNEELSSDLLRQFKSDAQLMSQEIDDVCLARGNNPLPSSRLALIVELSKSDENLKQDFARWLSKKRRESMDTVSLKWWKRFDKKTFAKWHRCRVLGCIDLDLLAKAADLRLTHRQMAKALYPQVDLDQEERIKRTVRPLAERVLSWQTVSALRAAAK